MTTREITEFHKAQVSCGDSPTGKHFVRLCWAGDTVTHVSCDCQDEAREGVAAGRALVALGGESCVSVVDVIRVQLRIIAQGGTSRYSGERVDPRTGTKVDTVETYKIGYIPVGLVHAIKLTTSASDSLREKRVQPASDDRSLYHRLLSKRVHALAPCLGVVVQGHPPTLVFKRHYDGEVVAASRQNGQWRAHGVSEVADQVGMSSQHGGGGRVCHVCPKHAQRQFDNGKQHRRGTEHKENVARVVRELVKKLNRGSSNG